MGTYRLTDLAQVSRVKCKFWRVKPDDYEPASFCKKWQVRCRLKNLIEINYTIFFKRRSWNTCSGVHHKNFADRFISLGSHFSLFYHHLVWAELKRLLIRAIHLMLIFSLKAILELYLICLWGKLNKFLSMSLFFRLTDETCHILALKNRKLKIPSMLVRYQ